jgi:hypothetical protein
VTAKNAQDRPARPLKKETVMPTEQGKTVLSAEEARQCKELGVMRYVLHISLALSVVAGIVIYAIFFH